MSLLNFQAYVFKSSATDTSTSAVDFVIPQHMFPREWMPQVSQPIMRPLDGRAESQPWYVDILDVSSTFTSRLADSSGRPVLLRRIFQLLENRDAGGWKSIGVGRISDIALNDDVATYRVNLADELYLTRDTRIFTTNTTRLYPGGPHTNYGPFSPPPKADGYAIRYSSALQRIRLYPGANPPLTEAALESITNDVASTASAPTGWSTAAGNFTNLRLRIGTTDFPVMAVVFNKTKPVPVSPVLGLDYYRDNPTGEVDVWIAASTSQLGGSLSTSNELSSAFLHMFGAEPSAGCPLHIGSSGGITIPSLLNNIFSGAYSSSGAVLARYSTSALGSLAQRPIQRFRVTEPANMETWCEEYLYAPYGILPFVDSSGTITHRSVWLPSSSGAITAPTLTAANLGSHPTWDHQGDQQATVVRCTYTDERFVSGKFNNFGVAPPILPVDIAGGDRMLVTEKVAERTHDRVAQFGRRVKDFRTNGLHTQISDQTGPLGGLFPFGPKYDTAKAAFTAAVDRIANETFDRYGDGPIAGTLSGLSTAKDLNGGDWVAINLQTYPNPSTQGRGGTRFVQVLGKDYTPAGPDFAYLDGGRLNALSAPNVGFALSTANYTTHTMPVVVANVATGAKIDVEMAVGSTLPSTGSSGWRAFRLGGAPQVTTAGTYTASQLPANTTMWLRARASAPRRIRSGWNIQSSDSVIAARVGNTAPIPAPTISGAAYSSGRWRLKFAYGSSNYPTQVFLDDSTSASFTTANLVDTMSPGSQLYEFYGLATGTYLTGVRHADPYGGFSAADSTTFASTEATPTAPNLFGLYVSAGRVV